MKQILDYFMIDGEVGGNQDWFRNVVMHIGGCDGAAPTISLKALWKTGYKEKGGMIAITVYRNL